ncbi:carboxymuconolactone decarboxylase family protein [Streptomyces chiangmaiensis]|uniref:Carboxymuconolactone decarboxylase family protein n=1 Tax=Streptomyces chiangmaiensis TaxID=766497 RepID=A0ABU7FU64_9ACTN|nr:hypothetical protein [Streptomyces chiangmaiensis]MED7827642.1 hypothetical protein [Streptomyces chiangmaiensis]
MSTGKWLTDISDSTWTTLTERYDEQQMLEVFALVGLYRFFASMLNSCRVPLDDWQTAHDLPPVQK